MTTNITALAQRLKLEVHRAVSNFNPQMNIKTRDLKELLGALEKTQAKADIYDMLRDDYGLREKGVGLADFVDWQAKRIAELESRTVKLPKLHAHLIWIQAGHAPDDYWDDVAVSHSEKDRCCDGSERYPVYARWEIEEMMSAAGIKVEDE